MRYTMLALVLCAVAVVGCARSEPQVAEPPTAAAATAEPTATPHPLASARGAPPIFEGTVSYEEQIVWADVVARVTLSTVQAGTDQATVSGEVRYYPAFVFTFTVLEYLKGSGASTVTAVAMDGGVYSTGQSTAQAEAVRLIADRDTTYDSRQAVVFMKSTSTGNRYFLGYINISNQGDNYTIGSKWGRRWLPAASQSASGQSGATEQSFLLEDPGPRREPRAPTPPRRSR